MAVRLNSVELPIITEDLVLEAQSFQVGAGTGRKEQGLAGLKIDRETGAVPLGKLEPAALRFAKPEIVLPAACPFGCYFRTRGKAFFTTPGEKRAPLPAGALAFRDASSIRSIWA